MRPTRGQLVTVRCSGQLDDGTTVDEHDRLELCVGEDDFIPGIFPIIWTASLACIA